AVTGQLPFGENGPDDPLAPPRPRELRPVAAALEVVILDCLRPHPRERPASMREIAARLAGARAVGERATELLPPPPAAPRRWRARLLLAAAMPLGLVAGWALLPRSAPPPPPVTALRAEPSPPSPPAATFAPPSAPAAAHVVLRSQPPGAQVWIDRVRTAVTPASLALALPHEIVLVRRGY